MQDKTKKIQVQNISYKSGGVSILEDITFDMNYGSFASIIGPNGAGKSTLIKIMLGLLKQTSGEIFYEGRTPSTVNRKHHLLGYVPQYFQFDRTLPITLEEFFRFTCHISDDNHFNDILNTLNILKLKNHLLGKLSGGELQRTLIAYNLLHNHQIIFLDEPTSAIDMEGENLIYSILKEVNEKYNKTIIIVSHDIETILDNVDTIICLNKTLHCIGGPEALVSNGAIASLFEKKKSLYVHKGCKH